MSRPDVPDYLWEPSAAPAHIYGVLSYDTRSDEWIIKGEPCVVQLAKRLFPGSAGRGSGEATFHANPRTLGDLNWLMLRYPLRVAPEWRAAWEAARDKAVRHVVGRLELLRLPQEATPSPLRFKGELLPFQREGLAFLLHNHRTLLADEMGLGKTVQALAFLAETRAWPALLVVPPHLITNWCREIERFLVLPEPATQPGISPDLARSVHVIHGLTPYELPPASVYVVHYLLLRGWRQVLPEMGFQAVVFDEVQELRHTGTEKYSAASVLAERAPAVIGLSGTPIHNRGGEIWPVTNILDMHCLGDQDSFSREWCWGYGRQEVRDPELLGDHLRREGLMLRRTKAMVLKELPPKRRVVQMVDLDQGMYDSLIEPAVAKARMIGALKDVLERGRLTREVVEHTRRATGIAKAAHVAAFVRMLLEAGERVLLFAYHHTVMDAYRDALADHKVGFVTGRETPGEKDQAVWRFKSGRTSVLCLSLRTSAGLNLQEASCVVFGELDWSPAVHSQCEDRAHRIGQRDSILCYYLVAADGTDPEIQDALGLKVSQFVGLMGDRPETEEDRILAGRAATEHMRRVVERLKGTKLRCHEEDAPLVHAWEASG